MSSPEPQHQKSEVLTREDLQEIYQKLESLENAKQQLEQKNQELSSEVENVREEMKHLKEQRAPGTHGGHTEDMEKGERPDPTQTPCSESPGTDQDAQKKQIEQLHQSLSSTQESNKEQQRRIDALHQTMEQVETLPQQLQDLKAQVTRLAEDVSALGKTEKKAAAKKTKSNVSDVVVEELREQMGRMEADSEAFKQKMGNLERQSNELATKLTASLEDIRTEVKRQRDEMAELKNQHDAMQQNVERHYASVSEEQRKLESEIKAGCQAVSFHAKLGSDVTVPVQETLVCSDVVSNHGAGYDPDSGVFTCPVPGTYLFLATASPNQLDDNKAAALDVVVEGRVCGGLCAYGHHWATAHCVVEVQVGDQVKLRTLPGEHHFAGEWWTSFTGLLLKTAL